MLSHYAEMGGLTVTLFLTGATPAMHMSISF